MGKTSNRTAPVEVEATVEAVDTAIETAVEEVEEAPKESQARRNFRAIMAAYAARNPKKYAIKKAELEKKLASIK